jgi:exopolysaccharide biosynthesis protein
MNATFFEFAHNSNLNLVVDNSEIKSYHLHSLPGKGKDTLTYRHVYGAALGISKSNKPDVAWVYTDTADANVYASQTVIPMFKDSVADVPAAVMLSKGNFKKWKVKTAIGGGPVLLQEGAIKITNNEELKFAGKAISDKHPRTAVGYTANNELILFVCEGRFPGRADGLTLPQMAGLMQQIGCVEAINLDGGGSSCLLVNGKETIKPSDKEGQRPVPAVFMIR